MSRRSTCDHSMIWLVETGWPSATRRAWSTARWTWPWGRIGRFTLYLRAATTPKQGIDYGLLDVALRTDWAFRFVSHRLRVAITVLNLATMDRSDMPRLDELDEEFEVDAAPAWTGDRLLMLAIVALGLGVIGAVVFAWSNSDGRLRFELQSAARAAEKCAARSAGDRAAARNSAGGGRAAAGRARRVEEGAHGNAVSGGAYHRSDEG